MRYELEQNIKQLSKNDKKTLAEKNTKLAEEVGELAKNVLAFKSAYGSFHKFATREMLVEDCADVMLVVLSMLHDLDATFDDVQDAMEKKCNYWSLLQDYESKMDNDLLPFEIHVSVKSKYDYSFNKQFNEVCRTLNVKPLYLSLHTKSLDIKDVMTSSTYRGTTQGAISSANTIKNVLENNGFEVVRVKIETFPAHPNSPKQFNNNIFAAGNYFEAHYEIVTNKYSDHNFEALKTWTRDCGKVLHLSSNERKKNDEQRITMVTLRSSQMRMEQFKTEVDKVSTIISDAGFTVLGKPLVEYAILDTNPTHDVEWLHEQH